MKTIATLGMISALLISFSIACCGAENAQPIPAPKPLMLLSGTDSHVTKPSCSRIDNFEEWTRMWCSHLGKMKDDAYRPHLEIDFERCMVIAIFRGEERNIRGMEIASMLENPESIVIRVSGRI